jgi:molybdenum cofactor cytidylyltransferase
MIDNKNIGVIILAAGASSRLGHPKQLLTFAGKSLLQQMIQVAEGAAAGSVFVVLGAHEDKIRSSIGNTSAHVIINEHWQEGMASSIRCGINALLQMNPQTDGALMMLCDQPLVTSALLNELIAVHMQTANAIVASSYGGIIGVPAFFSKRIFPALLKLTGDVGARAIIRQHQEDVAVVEFPDGSMDIDTADDFQRYQHNFVQ